MTWKPATIESVQSQLMEELRTLGPSQRARVEALLVQPYLVPVESNPGETVVVVGQSGDHVLYWSDVEEGWEFETLTPSGGIAERGCNQFDLSHVAHHLSG